MKKILITRKLIKDSEDKASKTFEPIFGLVFARSLENVIAPFLFFIPLPGECFWFTST